MKRLASLAAGLIVSALLSLAGPATGQKKEIIDRVLVVVEDRAILQSELEMEYRRYLFQNKITTLPAEEEITLRNEFLEGLLADLLMAVHAEKIGVEVSEEMVDDEVERAFAESIKSAGGEEVFNRELERAGLTFQQLRSQWREKIKARRLIEGLMYREVMTDISVTEQEIRQYYKENQAQLPQRPATVTLAQILIIPRASEKLREEALQRIKGIEAEINGGKDFAEAAKEHSEDPANAKLGGSLGYIKLEDLGSPPFEKAARKLLVGEMSPPVLTRFGYHLIKLEAVSGDEVNLRHILIALESGETDIEEAATRAGKIREEILAGADFGEMAKLHSDDEKTKDIGGVIEGEIVLENLKGRADYFLEMIKDLQPGEISPVINEAMGFRIVKVLSREAPRTYSYSEARDEIEKLIEQQKMQQKFKEYVEELKGIYYVDIKEDG